jgi:hypothetical protein
VYNMYIYVYKKKEKDASEYRREEQKIIVGFA